MYCDHFNLKKKPFQLSSDNSFLWLGKTHKTALDALQRGMNTPERLMVLTGDVGTGKTTLLHEVISHLPDQTVCAHITDPSMELHYLFLAIARGLGFEALYQAGEKFAPTLAGFLARLKQTGKRAVIIIDEAHLIPLRFLYLLLEWSRLAPDRSLTLFLAGQLEFHTVIETALGRSWKNKVAVHAMLAPLNPAETRAYILCRLELAGTKHPIFKPDTLRKVHEFSKGIPRRINIACDQAMIAACIKGIKTIDIPTFNQAAGILEIPAQPDVMALSTLPATIPSPQRTQSLQPRKRRPLVTTLAAAAALTGVAVYTIVRLLPPADESARVPGPKNRTAFESAPMLTGQPGPASVTHTAGTDTSSFSKHAISPVLQDSQPEAYEPATAAPVPPAPLPVPLNRPVLLKAQADTPEHNPQHEPDMDQFIKDVFMLDHPKLTADIDARTAPAPAPGPPPSQAPDDIIDWLIHKKRP